MLDENELKTLKVLKTRTKNNPLSDPLFRATDKYIRSTLLEELEKPEKEVKELVIRAYHRYVSDPTCIPPIVNTLIDNPLLQVQDTYEILAQIQDSESNLGKHTSMGLLHLTKKLMNFFKPKILKVDVFLIDLMRQVYGNRAVLNAISNLKANLTQNKD